MLSKSRIAKILGITAALIAVVVFAAVQYTVRAEQREADATAERIFEIAQAGMDAARTAGELQTFRQEASVDDLGTLMNDRPGDLPKADWPEKENDRYYYIRYNPGDEALLHSSILQYLLPEDELDASVREQGAYIIEYNLKNAFIYSVFYTADKDDFSYDDVQKLSAANGRAAGSIGESARRSFRIDGKKVIVGYYGGPSVVDTEGKSLEQPVMTVKNGDILQLEIADCNYFLPSENPDELLCTKMTLHIKGKQSKAEKRVEFLLDDNENEPKKKFLTGQEWWSVEKTDYAIDGKEIPAMLYTVTLDNITVAGMHFADLFPELLPGEDIIVTAELTSKNTSLEGSNSQVTVNSLFGSVSAHRGISSESLGTAEIYNVRHLENLDSGISGLPTELNDGKAEGTKSVKYLIGNVNQTGDIDWETFQKACGSGMIYAVGDTQSDRGILLSNGYYGIKNEALISYKGNGHSVKNLVIVTPQSDAGMFRAFEGSGELEIEDLNLENITAKGDNAGALIGSISGKKVTITNIAADSLKITANGRGHAGGLVGSLSGKGRVNLDEIKVGGIYAEAFVDGSFGGLIGAVTSGGAYIEGALVTGVTARISGEGDAGGLTGTIYDTGTVRIDGCAAADLDMAVLGLGNCGGIIGRITGMPIVHVRNTYAGGRNGGFNVYAGSGDAGGFIGTISGDTKMRVEFTGCYSSCSVSGSTDTGGFVGADMLQKTSYKSCYAIGRISSGGGTFAGKMSGGRVSDVYVLDGINGDLPTVKTGSNVGSIEKRSNSQMKEEGNARTETHTFDEALLGKVYPFKTVNKVGMTGENVPGVHYGDWPNI